MAANPRTAQKGVQEGGEPAPVVVMQLARGGGEAWAVSPGGGFGVDGHVGGASSWRAFQEEVRTLGCVAVKVSYRYWGELMGLSWDWCRWRFLVRVLSATLHPNTGGSICSKDARAILLPQ